VYDASHATGCVNKCPINVCNAGQEWNISRGELDVLSALGLLSEAEVERCIVSAWNPVSAPSTSAEDCRL
jgi:hypothetical protein